MILMRHVRQCSERKIQRDGMEPDTMEYSRVHERMVVREWIRGGGRLGVVALGEGR